MISQSCQQNTQRISNVNTHRIIDATMRIGMGNRRDEMANRLRDARKRAGYVSAKAAAEAFGLSAPTLTSHENGTREFDVETAIRYSKIFKSQPGFLLALDKVEATPSPANDQGRRVRWLGKVAAGLWTEQSYIDGDEPRFVIDYSNDGEDVHELFSVTPEGQSMNLTPLPEGQPLICRRVPFGIAEAVPGDLVVVERQNHDLRELTVKRLALDGDEFILKCESDRPEFQDVIRIGKPSEDFHIDAEVRIIGIVLHAIIDLRRR